MWRLQASFVCRCVSAYQPVTALAALFAHVDRLRMLQYCTTSRHTTSSSCQQQHAPLPDRSSGCISATSSSCCQPVSRSSAEWCDAEWCDRVMTDAC